MAPLDRLKFVLLSECIPFVTIVASKNPQVIIVDCSPMSRSCRRQPKIWDNKLWQINVVVDVDVDDMANKCCWCWCWCWCWCLPSSYAPLSPLSSVKLVLKQVILVLKVGVGVKITYITWNSTVRKNYESSNVFNILHPLRKHDLMSVNSSYIKLYKIFTGFHPAVKFRSLHSIHWPEFAILTKTFLMVYSHT